MSETHSDDHGLFNSVRTMSKYSSVPTKSDCNKKTSDSPPACTEISNSDHSGEGRNKKYKNNDENDTRHKRAYSSSSGASENENLRSACDACTHSKIRCLGGRPCIRCRKRGRECRFSEKRRCGPKKRDDAGTSSALSTRCGEYPGKSIPSAMEATPFSSVEKQYLDLFLNVLNVFLPVVSKTILTAAVLPISPGSSDLDKQRRHAYRAALWGSVSIGALFSHKESEANEYNERARLELKECFDSPVEELTSVFLLLTLFYLHRVDNAKLVRYAGFARQSLRELQFIPADLAASVHLLQVALYLTGAGEPPEVLAPTPRTTLRIPQGLVKQRILNIIAYIMMSIYTSLDPDSDPNKIPCFDHLLSLAREIKGLIESMNFPDDMSLVTGCVLQGYLLLRTGRIQEATSLSESAAESLCANPFIMKFPLTWIMSCCVLEGLRRFGRPEITERLHSIMLPLSAALPFSSRCCRVGAEMLSAYAGFDTSKEVKLPLCQSSQGITPQEIQSQKLRYYHQYMVFQQQQQQQLEENAATFNVNVNYSVSSSAKQECAPVNLPFIFTKDYFNATQVVMPQYDGSYMTTLMSGVEVDKDFSDSVYFDDNLNSK